MKKGQIVKLNQSIFQPSATNTTGLLMKISGPDRYERWEATPFGDGWDEGDYHNTYLVLPTWIDKTYIHDPDNH